MRGFSGVFWEKWSFGVAFWWVLTGEKCGKRGQWTVVVSKAEIRHFFELYFSRAFGISIAPFLDVYADRVWS